MSSTPSITIRKDADRWRVDHVRRDGKTDTRWFARRYAAEAYMQECREQNEQEATP